MKRIIPSAKPKGTSQAEVDKFWNRKFNITSFLFDKQLAFIQDPSPYKVAVCSRRAGKTVACAAHLIDVAINTPNVVCIYITLSAANAKKLVWKELKKINDNYKLEGVPSEADGSITFRNGSVVYISGAKDKSEIEKFRGLPIKLCYIDECQSFREYIKDLIDDIIEPALLDYAGTLCLIGTPRATPTGYFYECAHNNEIWSSHKWTFFDNPHIVAKSGKTHQELLERVLKRRSLTISDPSIQREYYGIWANDSDSLLIKYDAAKNDWNPPLPQHNYNYIMGIDVGFKDADAICILAWSEHDPVTYLIEESIETKQGITELANKIKELDAKYHVHKMVMDMGALGKKIGEELVRRHQIPVEAAEKQRKMENIELLNDALRRGHLKASMKSRFAQDTYLVEIDRDKSTPERIAVSNDYHSDVIDAVLYAFKFSPAYAYEPPTEKLVKGTKEWAEAQSKQMFEAELEGMMAAEQFEREYGDY